MQLSRIAVSMILGLALAGCTRALPFNFIFRSDGGQNSNDLAMTLDMAGTNDLGSLVDQSIPDLSSGPELGTSNDLAMNQDMTKPADLRASDLHPNDLVPASKLGMPCNPIELMVCGTEPEWTCLTSYLSEATITPIEGGYCTRQCTVSSECTSLGGSCMKLGSTKYCMPTCVNTCSRDNYSCCNYCESNGGPCWIESVCAPPGAPGFCG